MPYHRHLVRNLMGASRGMRVAAILAALVLVFSVVAVAFGYAPTTLSAGRIDLGGLLTAAAATMARLLAAHALSLLFALTAAYVVTTYRPAEAALMPLFDVLQSVPVLAFFPVAVLDEPTSALDPQTAATLHRDLLRIWRECRMTVLMVSHSLEETLTLADRVVVMGRGKVVQEVPIEEARPRDPQSASLRRLHGRLEQAIGQCDATP